LGVEKEAWRLGAMVWLKGINLMSDSDLKNESIRSPRKHVKNILVFLLGLFVGIAVMGGVEKFWSRSTWIIVRNNNGHDNDLFVGFADGSHDSIHDGAVKLVRFQSGKEVTFSFPDEKVSGRKILIAEAGIVFQANVEIKDGGMIINYVGPQ
jgi:hypothetical protein